MKLLILSMFLLGSFSAQVNRDSLKHIINESISSAEINKPLIRNIQTLAYDYRKDQWDSSFHYHKLARDLSITHDLGYLSVGISYKGIGNLYFDKGDYSSAIKEYFDALDIYIENGDQLNIADIYSYIAYLYFVLEDYNTALDIYHKAMEINKAGENIFFKRGYAHNLLMIASIYIKIQKFEEANQNSLEAEKINIEIMDTLAQARSQIYLAEANRYLGNSVRAIQATNEGIKLLNSIKRVNNIDAYNKYQYNLFLEKSKILSFYSDYKNAIKLLENCIQFCNERKLYRGELNALNELAQVYLNMKNYNAVVKIFSDKLNESNYVLFRNEQIAAKNLLSKAHRELNDISEAFRLLNEVTALKDSVKSDLIYRNLTSLSSIYNVELRKRTTDLMEKEIESRNKENIYLIMILVILGISIMAFIYRHRKNLKLTSELAEKNLEKNTLIRILAHDLRNPFSSFLGYCDILNFDYDGMDDETKKDIVKEINTSAHRYFDLLENLLAWIKNHSESHEISEDRVFLYPLINQIIHVFDTSIKFKNIAVTIEIDEEFELLTDKNMLMAIIRNLINNALKFSNQEGVVNIAAEKTNGNAVISISDNGIGMDEDLINNLFNSKIDMINPGTARELGVGFGMIIINELSKKLGAKISVKSKKDKGTTFTINLPLNF